MNMRMLCITQYLNIIMINPDFRKINKKLLKTGNLNFLIIYFF